MRHWVEHSCGALWLSRTWIDGLGLLALAVETWCLAIRLAGSRLGSAQVRSTRCSRACVMATSCSWS
jgi:hypothetical protein